MSTAAPPQITAPQNTRPSSVVTQSEASEGGGEGQEGDPLLTRFRALVPVTEELRRDVTRWIEGGRVGSTRSDQQVNSTAHTCIATTETEINTDTLELYLRLREANKMCKAIRKDLMFNREVLPMDSQSDVFVRATDFAHNITIIWSYDTFLDRMEPLTARYNAVQAGEMAAGDVPVSELFENGEVWERDLSVLGDTLSTTSGSDGLYFSFNHSNSLNSSSSNGSRCQSEAPLLQLLQEAPSSVPRVTGIPACDSVLESVSALNSTLSLLGSQIIRSRAMVPKVTFLVTCLHRDVLTWSASTKNHRMSQTTLDLVSLLSNTLRHLSECRIAADLPKLQEYLLELVYQAGRECAVTFLSNPSTTPSTSAGGNRSLSVSPDQTPGGRKELDATSDYASSSGSLETLGEFEERIKSRLLQGVSDHLTESLDLTTAGLSRIIETPGDSSLDQLRGSAERFTKSLVAKKQELTRTLAIHDSSASVPTLLAEAIQPSRLFSKLDEIQSWSRIVFAALGDKENRQDCRATLHQALGQLSSRLDLALSCPSPLPLSLCSSPSPLFPSLCSSPRN